MKKMQILGATLLCGASCFALASCNKGEGETGNKVDKNKKIVFYCSAGNKIDAPIKAKVEAFNKANPGWVVEIQNPGDYDKLKDKVKADLKVNNQPAIAYCYPDHIAEYLSGTYKKKVIDLQTRFIANDTEFSKINFIDSYYNEGKIFEEGKLYTLPFVKSTEAMYVNVQKLAAVGIKEADLAEKLSTWEGLFGTDTEKGVLDLLREQDPKTTPLGIDSSDNLFITLCEQYGLPYTQNAATPADRFLFNNAKVKTMLKSLNAECKGGFVTTRDILGTYTSDKFKTGEIAISMGSTGGAGHQDPNGAFDYKVLPYPHPAKAEGNGISHKAISQGPSLVMFEQQNDEKEDMAWKFVKTLFEDDLQTGFSQKSGYMPVTETAYEVPAYKEFLNGESIVGQTISMAKTLKDSLYVSPAFNGSNTARQEVGKLLNKALSADVKDVDTTIDAALEKAIKECLFFSRK